MTKAAENPRPAIRGPGAVERDFAGLEGEDFTDEIRQEAGQLASGVPGPRNAAPRGHRRRAGARGPGRSGRGDAGASRTPRAGPASAAYLAGGHARAARGRSGGRTAGGRRRSTTAIPLELFDVPETRQAEDPSGRHHRRAGHRRCEPPADPAGRSSPRRSPPGSGSRCRASGPGPSPPPPSATSVDGRGAGRGRRRRGDRSFLHGHDRDPEAGVRPPRHPDRGRGRRSVRGTSSRPSAKTSPSPCPTELDNQLINGNGTAPNLKGPHQEPRPTRRMPGAAAATFDDFLSAFAGGVDGLWASRMNRGFDRLRGGYLPPLGEGVP